MLLFFYEMFFLFIIISDEDSNELRLFFELSEMSSDEDSDHEERVFTDDQHIEHLGFAEDKNTKENNTNEDSSGQLLVKLLAMMLLTWQAVFNISDNAITALLLCLRQLMWLIGNILSVYAISNFAGMIPKTLYSIRKYTSINRDNFTECCLSQV